MDVLMTNPKKVESRDGSPGIPFHHLLSDSHEHLHTQAGFQKVMEDSTKETSEGLFLHLFGNDADTVNATHGFKN